MFSFVLSLLVLTAMFSVISGAAFLLRRTLLKGREGMMYPFWVIILLISIIPLKIDIPDLPAMPHFSEQTSTEATEFVYLGDYSEIERAELHSQRPTDPIIVEMKHENHFMLEARRFFAANGKHADTVAAIIFILWMAGAVFHFSNSMITYVNTKQIMRVHSSACTDERMRRLFEDCRRRLGVRQSIELRVFDIESFCSPCVCGIVRPTLYLEPGCAKLSDRELSCVLIHELTHIKRFDVVHKLFCLIVTAVHWFNPSSRRIQRTMFEDCELACDYSVVRAYGNAISPLYMNTILDFVERFSEKNRLVGQSGIGGGLFISQPSGAAFLKRRFANMKNFRKDRLATILTGVFTAVCAIANVFVLSSCSGITPDALSSAIDLTPPVEQMVRAHYGLSEGDFITPDMVDGITSLKIELNEQYEDHILVEFTVNGEEDLCQPLPAFAIKNYYDSCIMPPVEALDALSNETANADQTDKINQSINSARVTAFYRLLDPYDPVYTASEVEEMVRICPECAQNAVYQLDPTITKRETNMLYGILDNAGVLEPWELDSYAFDCSSFAYFANLSEVEFIGLTPIGYSFPDTIKVSIGDAEPTDDAE